MRYLQLFKLRVVVLLVLTAVVAALVSAPGALSIKRLLILALAGGIACIGSAFLNHYFDRDIDALMARTKRRPLPAGMIGNPELVLWLGLLLVGISLVLSTLLNLSVTLFIFLGAFVYVVVYTLGLKRRSPSSTVIGGLSGSFAALAGWAAVSSQPAPAPFLIASIVFLWTPPHFWSFALAHKQDYDRAGIPMVPQSRAGEYILGSTGLLVLTALFVNVAWNPFGWTYVATALVLGGLFLAMGARLLRNISPRTAWQNYKVSGVYLVVLLVAMVVDRLGGIAFF
ncbi:MAG: protoheme IX farnesyltransferase [Chloroflexi bacterium]|nr:protoheme IX farnesyltransferase [Chloroflexota bacterium]